MKNNSRIPSIEEMKSFEHPFLKMMYAIGQKKACFEFEHSVLDLGWSELVEIRDEYNAAKTSFLSSDKYAFVDQSRQTLRVIISSKNFYSDIELFDSILETMRPHAVDLKRAIDKIDMINGRKA